MVAELVEDRDGFVCGRGRIGAQGKQRAELRTRGEQGEGGGGKTEGGGGGAFLLRAVGGCAGEIRLPESLEIRRVRPS